MLKQLNLNPRRNQAVCTVNRERPEGWANRGTVVARQIKAELLASWREHGPAALETVVRERPLDYLRLVVSLLPSDAEPGPSRLDSILLPDPPGGRHVVPGLLDAEP